MLSKSIVAVLVVAAIASAPAASRAETTWTPQERGMKVGVGAAEIVGGWVVAMGGLALIGAGVPTVVGAITAVTVGSALVAAGGTVFLHGLVNAYEGITGRIAVAGGIRPGAREALSDYLDRMRGIVSERLGIDLPRSASTLPSSGSTPGSTSPGAGTPR